MLNLILIGLGGALGSIFRYLVQGWVQSGAGIGFPAGTLAVNAAGCAAIGFLMTSMTGAWMVREEYRLALVVGVLGGFTTFSAFGYETLALLRAGQFGLALANVAAQNVLGLAAAWLGYRLALLWPGPAA